MLKSTVLFEKTNACQYERYYEKVPFMIEWYAYCHMNKDTLLEALFLNAKAQIKGEIIVCK